MNKYNTLLFDLDDTLIDNSISMQYAFQTVLKVLNINYSDELFHKWELFDIVYWDIWQVEKENLSHIMKDDRNTFLRANRFILFFKNLNINYQQAKKLNEIYCKNLSVNIVEIENASNLIKELKHSHKIVIATNGPHQTAIEKVKKANLYKHVNYVISSDEAGFSKPMPEFFQYLDKKVNNYDKETTLIIGDNLSTDILGGTRHGIDTCWFNPKEKEQSDTITPTFTIKKLTHLKKVIKK